MHVLYWNPIAINLFLELIMAALLSVFFASRYFQALRTRKDIRLNLFLLVTFSAAGIGAGSQFLSLALHPDYVDYALPFVSPFGIIAMAGFVLFIFYYKRPDNDSKRFEISLIMGLCVATCIEFYVAILRLVVLQDGFVEYREAWLDIPLTLGFFIAHGILVFRLTEVLATEEKQTKLRAFRHAIHALIVPTVPLSRSAAPFRAFFYVATLPALIGIISLLRGFGVMEWSLVEVINCWLILLVFFGFSIVYLNHIPEQSSFLIKLVGATLTTVLTILCGISWLIGSVYIEAYQSPHRIAEQSSIRFEPAGNGSYSVARTTHFFNPQLGERIEPRQAVRMEFSFPFYGMAYDEVFLHPAGMVGFEGLPIWRDVQHKFGPHPAIFLLAVDLARQSLNDSVSSGFYHNASQSLSVFTWNNLVSPSDPEAFYTFQLRLFPSGVIEMAYETLPERYVPDLFRANALPMMTGIVPAFENRNVQAVRFADDLPLLTATGQGAMEYHHLDFRAYLDRIYRPTAIFIVLSSLMILLIFPRFFQTNLNAPLQTMLRGVKQILDGNLSNTIEVRHHDEIGYLASAFNEMTVAQRQLVDSLEIKVEERSTEAANYAAENARLQERSHLARELHDAVSQTIFSSHLIANAMPDLWKKNPKKALEAMGEIQRLNHHALTEMRYLLLELRPEKMLRFSFGQLLRHSLDDIRADFPFVVTLNIEHDITLPPDVQLAFFRVAQEALHNAAKHSKASCVTIYFDGIETQCILTVTDDGNGFSPSDVTLDNLGLQFMKERLQGISGTLEINSSKGVGTVITAIWQEGCNEE